MNSLTDLLANRTFWEVLVGYWLFSAAVGAMPTPTQNSSPFYIWIFRFGHGLSGNLSRAAVALKIPGAEADK